MSKKVRKSKRICIFLVVIILIFACFSLLLNCIVYPVVIEYAEAKVKNMTVTAVNNAIISVLSSGIDYNDLITINTDNNGNILYLEANAAKINSIAQNTSKKSKTELDRIGEQILKIPIGSLTKSPLLTGYGPPVSVKILTDGSVVCRFKSVFTEAGINQTRHKIFIEVCANMHIILPSSQYETSSTVEIFIAEAIIVGKVPDAYLNIGAFDKINFLPD